MTKRGRKTTKNSQKNYFTEEQEKAVLDYINSTDDVEKNRIYNEKLRFPFNKMVESIIRRYKLMIPDEEFEETFTDTLSFLITKIEKFKPGKYKAYSYYGTICKNHLIGRIQEYSKNLQKNVSYSYSESTLSDSIKYSDYKDDNSEIASESFSGLIDKIGVMIEHPSDYKLKDNEIKVGKALKTLLENWDYVLSTDGSNKLNKHAILFFLRENTGLNSKAIREGLKKYKTEFHRIKGEFLK